MTQFSWAQALPGLMHNQIWSLQLAQDTGRLGSQPDKQVQACIHMLVNGDIQQILCKQQHFYADM